MGKARLGSLMVLAAVLALALPADAAPSPYLGKIAFESERLGPTELFVMRPDGSGVTRLNTPGGGADASWSPDGRRVAFGADPDGDGNVDIYVMNADGSELLQLTDAEGHDIWPDWFRGGDRIVFTSLRTGSPNIYVMKADGSGESPLTNSSDTASLTPVVSPSNTEIAFTRITPVEPPRTWVMNADGTGQHPLTGTGNWEDTDPAWSIDGRQIAFSRFRPGLGSEIFLINADGSNLTQLTSEPGADWTPTFSPDNRYIAWTASRQGNFDVWVMNRDGSGKTRLTTDPAFDGFPDWHQSRLLTG